MSIKSFIKKIFNFKYIENNQKDKMLIEKLALGKLLTNYQSSQNSLDINDYEFKIFSQCGDDGIIQYLIKNINIQNNYFIEFGVGDFLESNCRFLMMNNNWSGFVMDDNYENIKKIKRQTWYWMYDINAKNKFIDKTNINSILIELNQINIGILHIDIDGNDYHIFKELDLTLLNPSIIIIEYNSVFGSKRAITIPYRSDFNRTKAHYSNLFFGASLSALDFIANKKGYSLIGSNSAGNNAYFVRNDLLNERIKKINVKNAYKKSKFRESRFKNGNFSFIGGDKRLEKIKGLKVLNVISGKMETL